MVRPAQVKRNNKYAKKSKLKKGDIRLNLGENNHIYPKDFDSGEYKKALARSKAKDPFKRAYITFFMVRDSPEADIYVAKSINAVTFQKIHRGDTEVKGINILDVIFNSFNDLNKLIKKTINLD